LPPRRRLEPLPSGCFEQTSATTYPNALVLEHLRATGKDSPQFEARARSFLKAGWKRLVSYEVPGGGFSWFGHAPANKILTAFGVMEFHRIGQVLKVDPDVAQRTRRWLLEQRESDGSYKPDASYLHAESWSQFQNASLPVTAYVTWALAVGGASEKDLAPSVAWLEKHAAQANDPYVVSLTALGLSAAAPSSAVGAETRGRLKALARRSEQKVHWTPETSTHTHARGGSAATETTAISALALLAADDAPRCCGRDDGLASGAATSGSGLDDDPVDGPGAGGAADR
jgi:uncharacterized protein YfaS (alpha-2-macroglobulin family)